MDELTAEQAQAALDVVERSRRRVIDEIDVPAWYWVSMAVGWVVLGVIADLDHPWVTSGSTLAFGMVHSWVAPRVVDGRHGNPQVSVRADVAGPRVARAVLGGLVAMVAVTVLAALAQNADGDRHPSVVASVMVAIVILLGGPLLLADLRRRAARAGADT